MTLWVMDQAPLGFRAPRPSHPRLQWCPACERGNPLSSRHVLQECVAVSEARVTLGITAYMEEATKTRVSSVTAYRRYVTGMKPDGTKGEDYGARGLALSKLQEEWLNTWDRQVFAMSATKLSIFTLRYSTILW